MPKLFRLFLTALLLVVTHYSFATVPTIVSVTPSNNAVVGSSTTGISFTFDQTVTAVSGKKIYIYEKGSPDVLIDQGDVGLIWLTSGTTFNATLSTSLNSDKTYYILFDAGAFKNGGNELFAGYSSDTDWTFSTPSPKVVSLSPADNATGVSVSGNQLIIDFDVNISIAGVPNSKKVRLFKTVGNIAVTTVNANSATISGSTATITIPGGVLPLSLGTDYHVIIDTDGFKDASTGELYSGISSNTSWNFRTASGVSITAPTLSNICTGGGYKALGNMVITEGAAIDFAVGASQLLVLKAPTNYEFQSNTGSVSVGGGSDISLLASVISSDKIYIFYNITATANINNITISGLNIRALGASSPANITSDATSTANIIGLTTSTILATLNSIALPTVTLSVASTSVCAGESVTFTGSGSGVGGTYNFFVNNVSVQNGVGTTYTTSSLTNGSIVRVEGTNTAGCTNTSLASTMTVKPLANIYITSNDVDNKICFGNTITFTANGNADTYYFSLDGGAFGGAVTTFTTLTSLPVGLHNVKLKGTKNGCDIITGNFDFEVVAKPVVSLTLPTDQYYQNQNGITLSGGSPSGGTYSGAGVASNLLYPSILPLGSSSITYTYTDANGCSNSISQSITINPPITAPIINLIDKVCSDSPVSPLNFNPSLGIAIADPSLGNAGTFSVQLNNSGVYYYDSSTGYNYLKPDYIGGGPGVLTFVAGAYSIIPSAIPAIYFDGNGEYKFTIDVVYRNASYTYYPAQVVTISKKPTLTFISGLPASGGEYCKEASSVLNSYNVDFPGGIYTYTLKELPSGTTVTLADGRVGFSTLTAGVNYEFVAKYTRNGCVVTDTRTFHVNKPPIPAFVFNPASTYCEGSTVLFLNPSTTVDNEGGSFSVINGYFRLFDASGSTILQTYGFAQNVIPLVGYPSGTYQLEYNYKNIKGCNEKVTQSFTIFPKPTPTFAFDAGATSFSVCLGNDVKLTPSSGFYGTGNIFTLTADGVSTNFIANSTTFTTITAADIAAAGGAKVYSVTYRYKDANGCIGTSSPLTLTVNPLPVLSFSFPAGNFACESATNASINVGVNEVYVPSKGFFTFTRGAYTKILGAGTNVVDPSELASGGGVGNYTVTFTYTNASNCTNTTTGFFEVYPLPAVDFSFATANNACENITSMTLSPNVTPYVASRGFFTLTKGAYTLVLPNGINTFNPNFLANEVGAGIGNYNVTFTYANANGCQGVSTAKVFTINALPPLNFNFGGGNSACEDVMSVNINVTSPIPASYTAANGFFTFIKGAYTLVLPNGTNNFSPNFLANQVGAGTGVYDVFFTYTDGNSCTNTSVIKKFTVNALPGLVWSSSFAGYKICEDVTTFTLTPPSYSGLTVFSGSNGFFTFKKGAFTASLTNGTNTFNPKSTLFDVAGAGVYQMTYTYTDTNGCSQTSSIQPFEINPLPLVDFDGFVNLSQYCLDAPTFDLVPKVNGSTTGFTVSEIKFEIRKAGGSFETLPTGKINPAQPLPSQVTPDINSGPLLRNVVAGVYEVKMSYKDPNGCSNTTSVRTFIINELPVIGFTIGSNSACVDAGDVTIVTNVSNEVQSIVRSTVTIQKLLSAYSANLTVIKTSGIPDVYSATFNTTALEAAAGAGDYTITFQYTTANGCSYVISKPFKLNALPALSLGFVGNQAFACQSATNVDLLLNTDEGSPVPSKSFIKITKGAFVLSLAAGENKFNPSILAGGAGVYNITFTYTNTNGCTNSTSKSFTVYALPKPNFAISKICFGDSTEFKGIAGIVNRLSSDPLYDPLESVEWNFAGNLKTYVNLIANPSDSVGALNQKFKFANPGKYTVKLKIKTKNSCDFERVNIDVVIGPIPVATYKSVRSFCREDGVKIVADSNAILRIENAYINQYKWYFDVNNVSAANIVTTNRNTPNITFVYPQAGKYLTALVVTSNLGCKDSTTRWVTVHTSVPAITPLIAYEETFDSYTSENAAALNGWVAYGKIKKATKDSLNAYSWTFGVPNGSKITSANTYGNAWKLKNTGVYENSEESYVTSPCFDLSALSKPSVALRYWADTERSDGVILQIDTNSVGEPKWITVGKKDLGISWYNEAGLSGQVDGINISEGWTNNAQTEWKTARYNLDAFKGKSKVRFRIAFGSNDNNPLDGNGNALPFDGFAFDNFYIGERNKLILLETFTNANVADANVENKAVKSFASKNGLEFFDIQYHTSFPTNDPMTTDNTADPSARSLYYGTSSVPTGVLDGLKNPAGKFSAWGEPVYGRRVLLPAAFKIDLLLPSIPQENIDIQAKVTALRNFSADSAVNVHIVVLEKEILGSRFASGSLDTFRNVVKKFLPDAAGSRFKQAWTAGTAINVAQSWRPTNVYDLSKLVVLAFVQNDQTGEILQAAFSNVVVPPTNTTGIADELVRNFMMYPNPAQNQVTIGFGNIKNDENFEIALYDNLGKIVQRTSIAKGKQGTILETNELSEGIYMVVLHSKTGGMISRKLVISR